MSLISSTLASLLLFTSAALAQNATRSGRPTATVDSGVLVGTRTHVPDASSPVNKYLGVPFAEPPVGDLRFAPPQTYNSSDRISTTQWKPSCLQQFSGPPGTVKFENLVFNNPAPEESEDCLYLNVYAPASPAPEGGRAVLFWIYGGGFQLGNAGQHGYDGSYFAGFEDVIVVSANYRTNVFGFPNAPELPIEKRNLGLLDQREALAWVQRNIAAFGGGPDKVTIFGESAGAGSVDALITSFGPGDSPPFRAGIFQSGSLPPFPDGSNSSAWDAIAAGLGCSGNGTLACVREANASDIQSIAIAQQLSFSPIADNVTAVAHPAMKRRDGNIARVPVMGGTNAQEGRVFIQAAVDGLNVSNIDIGDLLGGGGGLGGESPGGGMDPRPLLRILAAYPIGSPGIANIQQQIAAIMTEALFQCPNAIQLNNSAAVDIPTWRYFYTAVFNNTQYAPDLGAYHSSEIPLVFSTYPREGATSDQIALSNKMRGAWATFAKDPAAGPGWTSINDPSRRDTAVFSNFRTAPSDPIQVIPQGLIDVRCDLFTDLYTQFASGGFNLGGLGAV